jgi:hypothetical protein
MGRERQREIEDEVPAREFRWKIGPVTIETNGFSLRFKFCFVYFEGVYQYQYRVEFTLYLHEFVFSND